MNAKYVAGPAYRGGPGDNRKEGDPVPEANNWTQVEAWIKTGHIRLADSAEAVNSQPLAAQPESADDVSDESGPLPVPTKRRGRPPKKTREK